MLRFLACCCIPLLVAGPLAAGEYNPVLDIGDAAPAWKELPGVDGKQHSLAQLADTPVVVVFFTCNSCPYAVDYEDRILALDKKYDDAKVALVAINVNKVPEDLPAEMAAKAKAKGFQFAYLYDESQQIAKDYGAGYTPEFFVLDKDRKVVYMGALDDNVDPDEVKRKHVEAAIDAVLSGGKPEVTETPAVGCTIRFERRRRKK